MNRAFPQKKVLREAFRAYLMTGFPWHAHEVAHAHLTTADEWWAALAPLLEEALRRGAALEPSEAAELVTQVRAAYIDPGAWRVFDDTVKALELFAQAGWQQFILSNHVPELPQLVAALGLGRYFTAIHNSATSGFEKPHPRAYAGVLESLHASRERVVMIGDNYVADYVGARAAGLEAVLVRTSHPQCQTSFAGLIEAAGYLCRDG